MSFLGSIFPGDKELGKKDDDHKPGGGPVLPGSWHARKQVSGTRRRRLIYTALGLLALFFFYRNIPTDLGSNRGRRDVRVPQVGSLPRSPDQEPPSEKPPGRAGSTEAGEHYYDGPIKFWKLAASLHAAATLAGRNGKNKNILFAASNLKSAAAIMPMACEMAFQKRNDVHFAFTGREELEIHKIKEINGINDEDCPVHWHDGRPDYPHWSSSHRMELSVAASIENIHKFVAPQALLIDHQGREDTFFINGARSQAMSMGKSLIELPSDAAEKMMWITRLDSGSLAAWQITYIDLLIRAPSESSGSLIRLMKSIEAADYFGYRRPHLTIELPADIDGPTESYVENLIWPPLDWSGAPHASQVTLRHRIPKRTFTAAEASSYFIESFYPARPDDSHVVVLSPNVELSPLYYHYIMYNLLEYKYSKTRDSDDLIGISLELPSTYLNGTDPFEPPHPKGKPKTPTPFLWQAPSSNAALYFGGSWMELHSYLSNRISTLTPDTPKYLKQISESQPAWMEYVLELMRARGYTMLYPNYASTTSNALATFHSELSQPPEEYSHDRRKSPTNTDDPPPVIDPTSPFTADPATQSLNPPHTREPDLLTTSLLDILPRPGDLAPLSTLPLLFHDGSPISPASLQESSQAFTSVIRREIGACEFVNGKMDPEPIIYLRSAEDLFCKLKDKDSPEEFADDPESEPSPYDPHLLGRPPTIYQPPANYEPDVDAIPAEEVAQINNEFTAHLSRQGTSASSAKTSAENGDEAPAPKKPFAKDTITPHAKDPTELQDEKSVIRDRDVGGAEAEFFKHLRRQKAEENGEDEEATTTDERDTTKDEGKVQKERKGTVDEQGHILEDASTGPGEDGATRDPGW